MSPLVRSLPGRRWGPEWLTVGGTGYEPHIPLVESFNVYPLTKGAELRTNKCRLNLLSYVPSMGIPRLLLGRVGVLYRNS